MVGLLNLHNHVSQFLVIKLGRALTKHFYTVWFANLPLHSLTYTDLALSQATNNSDLPDLHLITTMYLALPDQYISWDFQFSINERLLSTLWQHTLSLGKNLCSPLLKKKKNLKECLKSVPLKNFLFFKSMSIFVFLFAVNILLLFYSRVN